MQELTNAIETTIDNDISPELCLREAAKKWAVYCVDTLDGDTLAKGLMISKAIAEYVNELERD